MIGQANQSAPEKLIRMVAPEDLFRSFAYNQVLLQAITYLDNQARLTEGAAAREEFTLEKFLDLKSNTEPGYYKFRQLDNSTLADSVYQMYCQVPASYGVVTDSGAVTFGLQLMAALASKNLGQELSADPDQFDLQTLSRILVDYEDLPIQLLAVDDIDCKRLDWINWLTDATTTSNLHYIIIGDLSLIYRPQIEPKLKALAQDAQVNIIGLVPEGIPIAPVMKSG